MLLLGLLCVLLTPSNLAKGDTLLSNCCRFKPEEAIKKGLGDIGLDVLSSMAAVWNGRWFSFVTGLPNTRPPECWLTEIGGGTADDLVGFEWEEAEGGGEGEVDGAFAVSSVLLFMVPNNPPNLCFTVSPNEIKLVFNFIESAGWCEFSFPENDEAEEDAGLSW